MNTLFFTVTPEFDKLTNFYNKAKETNWGLQRNHWLRDYIEKNGRDEFHFQFHREQDARQMADSGAGWRMIQAGGVATVGHKWADLTHNQQQMIAEIAKRKGVDLWSELADLN